MADYNRIVMLDLYVARHFARQQAVPNNCKHPSWASVYQTQPPFNFRVDRTRTDLIDLWPFLSLPTLKLIPTGYRLKSRLINGKLTE
jgi:hypothetical protein